MSNLEIKHNVDLTKLNSFGFTQAAAHYVETTCGAQVEQAVRLAQTNNWPILPLGGGSNLLLTRDVNALVIRQVDQRIRYANKGAAGIQVNASAGTNWHTLVMDTVQSGHIGLENLSLIPGSVGAAPVQNIGAYGVELSERFVSLQAFHIPTLSWRTLKGNTCDFSYRNSLFKQPLDNYIITDVTLSLNGEHTLRTHYGALAAFLDEHHQHEIISPQIVSTAVCRIRASKLPDPMVLPNAGSFFHNPVVSSNQFYKLKNKHPKIVAFELDDGNFKLAAGWMIDFLGYKAFRANGVGVHSEQALVLIKYGQSDGKQVLDLAQRIVEDVLDRFEVFLTIEPRIL